MYNSSGNNIPSAILSVSRENLPPPPQSDIPGVVVPKSHRGDEQPSYHVDAQLLFNADVMTSTHRDQHQTDAYSYDAVTHPATETRHLMTNGDVTYDANHGIDGDFVYRERDSGYGDDLHNAELINMLENVKTLDNGEASFAAKPRFGLNEPESVPADKLAGEVDDFSGASALSWFAHGLRGGHATNRRGSSTTYCASRS